MEFQQITIKEISIWNSKSNTKRLENVKNANRNWFDEVCILSFLIKGKQL